MKFIKWVILFAAITYSCAPQGGQSTQVNMDIENNEMDKISYSYGVFVGTGIKNNGFDSINVEIMAKAMRDVLEEQELLVAETEAGPILQAFAQKQASKKAEETLAKGREFLEQNKARAEVQVTESGLQYEVLNEGTGPSPEATDKVTVHYHGTFIDGSVFDSSVDRGQPSSFPLNGVIAGWTEGLQLMKVGAKYKFYIPFELAYGPQGRQGIPGNSTLIFDVELLSIEGK